MKAKSARKMLEAAGFTFDDRIIADMEPRCLWGWIKHEPYPVGKDHFEPRHRDVFIGPTRMAAGGRGYYVTSHIRGRMRRYRARTWDENAQVGNIFASGRTKAEAVANFLANYKARQYNRR